MSGAAAQPRHAIAIVGAGPRGTSVLERVCAAAPGLLAPGARLTAHVLDAAPPGPGRVWRTVQPRELLMNTVSSQVTLFTDESLRCEGPIRPGPSLYAWAAALARSDTAAAGYEPSVRAEAAALGPDDYPSRAFYGHYLEWVFGRIQRTAPDGVDIIVHRTEAVRLEDDAYGRQLLELDDGRILRGLDAVVLAQGHLPVAPTAQEEQLARHAAAHGLHYFPPANPADLDLGPDVVRPGEPVLLRGLGLNFFDHMALLTTGRGGAFRPAGDDDRLTYVPSGREPRILAGSRRGVPYHARGDNEKGAHGRHQPLLLTVDVIEALRKRAESGDCPDFLQDVWPLVAKEAETVYYATLLADPEGFRERYLLTTHGGPEEAAVLDEFGIPAAERWDWARLARPHRGAGFADRDAHRGWLLAHLRQDAEQARLGNVGGPLKAALDVLRDLRNELRLVVDHAGLTGDSHRDHLDRWYTPLNAFLSIGPPRRRIEELEALVEAGVVEVVGPRLAVEAGPGPYFTAESPDVPDSRVRVTALVEARLPEPDLRRTADPLLARLLERGECRPHRVGAYETGGLDVTESPYRLIDRAGRAHPRRFAVGVPTEGVHWVTAAGARPGVNSVTLADTDAVARAALRTAFRQVVTGVFPLAEIDS
ncbi:FAD/NAD(P)-binding protein [Streptomyces sp. NBC_01537]|uniref:FAD/NAD(P)-binding protein n=1 Tax=Streptomyces sp. NBC_01537 TaxID=2903896 RepID=UPI00386BAC75